MFRLFRKSRLRDGSIFFRRRVRFRRRNNHRLHNWRRWRSRLRFGNCHLRFWRRQRLWFFHRLGRNNDRLRRWRNDNWFWRFGFKRLGQRNVHVCLVENFRRMRRGWLQTKKHDGMERQCDCVKDYQRPFHCFNFVSIAILVIPTFRKSSSTSTAAPKNAFSSPLMKTFGSDCSVFN